MADLAPVALTLPSVTRGGWPAEAAGACGGKFESTVQAVILLIVVERVMWCSLRRDMQTTVKPDAVHISLFPFPPLQFYYYFRPLIGYGSFVSACV